MEVIKGKALRQDLNLYDGVNTTGQRKSSSGGYVDGLLIGDEVDVLSIHGQGRNRTQTAIQNCINSIGSLNRSIKFAPGTWTIESNTTIPANITSIIPAGVVFNISTGITLTFSGPYRCDSQNLKTGSGTLTFTDERMLQSVAGTNTITASVLSTLTVLANGQEFLLVPANSITAAATLNVNSTGAVNLRKNQSGGVVALVANDLIANNLYRLVYNSAGPYFMVNNVSSYAQGADVASATTINLDTATGDYIHVTGTTTIEGITLKQGQERTLVFDDALTLTESASLLILPTSAGGNILTVAGDTAIFRGEASGIVRCIQYQSETHGSYTGTLTGLTTTPTVSILYKKIGKIVFLENLTDQGGTSNTTALTITGAPAAIRPASDSGSAATAVLNNGTQEMGTMEMNSSGVLTFGRGSAAAFTNSGLKGVYGFTLFYFVP